MSGCTSPLLNPDASLLDPGAPSKDYRGQLFQSGDHRIKVTNGGSRPEASNTLLGIE